MSRRPHHHLAVCTDATLRPRRLPHFAHCTVLDNRTAHRWATLPDTSVKISRVRLGEERPLSNLPVKSLLIYLPKKYLTLKY